MCSAVHCQWHDALLTVFYFYHRGGTNRLHQSSGIGNDNDALPYSQDARWCRWSYNREVVRYSHVLHGDRPDWSIPSPRLELHRFRCGGRAIIDSGVLQLEPETLPLARAHQPICYESTDRCWRTPRQYSPMIFSTSLGATSRLVRWSSALTVCPALGLDVNAKQHDSCSYSQD